MYSKDELAVSSHDVNTFQFQQATIFTATLLFQTQELYKYIEMVFATYTRHIYILKDIKT